MATRTKSSTLKTRERTAEPPTKKKPNGASRQLALAPTRQEPEPELEIVEGEFEENEPLNASDAEVLPPTDPEPVAEERKGRGRPRGSKRVKEPEPEPAQPGDLFTSLYNASFIIKNLAVEFGRTPEQVLAAIGQIVGAAADLENPPEYADPE